MTRLRTFAATAIFLLLSVTINASAMTSDRLPVQNPCKGPNFNCDLRVDCEDNKRMCFEPCDDCITIGEGPCLQSGEDWRPVDCLQGELPLPPTPSPDLEATDEARDTLIEATHATGCPVGALPVTEVFVGNGGSWFQFLQDVLPDSNGKHGTWVKWNLQTNNINNGADYWFFGWELRGEPEDVHGDPNGEVQASGVSYDSFGPCQYLGQVDSGFYFFVEAAAGGWSSSSECTISAHWEVSVGIEFSATRPGGTEVTGTVGGSVACSDGTVFDSESLFKGRGYSDPVICAAPCVTAAEG